MKRLMTLACAVMLALSMLASPVFRVTKTIRQSDGKALTVTRTGADHLLYYITSDDIPVFPNAKGDYCYAAFDSNGNVAAGTVVAHEAADRTPMEQRLAEQFKTDFFTKVQMRNKTRYGVGSINLASVASKGDVKVPVILAEFQNKSFQEENNIERFSRHFNEENYKEEEGAGSVRDYFIAQSHGQFRPQFDIIAKVKVSQNSSVYGVNISNGDDKDATGFMAEAIELAEAQGADFSPYKNKNGDIMVIVIYPGHGEQVSGTSDDLWAAYYWSLSYTSEKTGLKFRAGLVMDELADYTYGEQFDGIGTLCHEFSHALGLPDFYNTNGATGIFGMDAWSLMDYGQFNNRSRTPVGYTAYEREFLGWMKIDTLRNEKQLVTLPPLHTDSTVRAYRILNEADASGNEYYIIENREESDWFLPLYGEGMLINHVDYNYAAWTSKNVNNNRNHQRMTVIPADGLLTPYGGGKASAYKGDLWPGFTNNMQLNSTTTPCDTAYVGRYMNIRMNNIHRDGLKNIVFYYQCSGQLTKVRGLAANEVGEQSFSLSWQDVTDAENYMVSLYQGETLLRTDTVADTHITYEELEKNTEYTAKLTAIADDYLNSTEASISVSTITLITGDVNRDGKINSADVVSIYNYVISGEQSGILRKDADVNADGDVNSSDVVTVYNIIIDGSPT